MGLEKLKAFEEKWGSAISYYNPGSKLLLPDN
jgi:hypothetical protein